MPRVRASAILIVVFLLILGFSLSFVTASVEVESYTVTQYQGHTFLNLKIKQDYLDEDLVEFVAVRLEVGVNQSTGEVMWGEPIQRSVISTSVWEITVEIDLGVVEGTPDAEISIYTHNYGWTPWFEPIEIRVTPIDYTPLLLGVGVVAVAVAAVYIILKRRRDRARAKLRKQEVLKRHPRYARAVFKS